MSSQTNSDGTIQWISKKKITLTSPIISENPYPFVFNNLYSCNINSEITGESILISNKYNSANISLISIISFRLTYNLITISTTSKFNYYLSFVSNEEASLGLTKIQDAIDGSDVQCTDTSIIKTFELIPYNSMITDITYPLLVFIDQETPVEVYSKEALIDYFNSISNGNFTVTDNVNPFSIDFNYLLYKTDFLPQQIKFLTRKLDLSLTGLQLFLKIVSKGEYFIIEDKTEVFPENFIYTFSTDVEKIIKIYFTDETWFNMEMSLASQITFNHTPSFLNYSTNSPNIKVFKSTGIILINLNELLSNSTYLENVTMTTSGAVLPDFSSFPLLNLDLEGNFSTNTLSLPSTISNLILKNLAIPTLIGNFENLKFLTIDGCRNLATISLPLSPLQNISISNSLVTSLTINDNFNNLNSFKLSGTQITAINLSVTSLKKLIYIDISYNDLMTVDDYNSFLSAFVTNNITSGGEINISNNFNLLFDLNLKSEILRKAWMIKNL